MEERRIKGLAIGNSFIPHLTTSEVLLMHGEPVELLPEPPLGYAWQLEVHRSIQNYLDENAVLVAKQVKL